MRVATTHLRLRMRACKAPSTLSIKAEPHIDLIDVNDTATLLAVGSELVFVQPSELFSGHVHFGALMTSPVKLKETRNQTVISLRRI